VTGDFRIWRACERFGIDPRAMEEESPGFVAKLIAYDEIRTEQEERMRVS
jgi:hypothetical protein